MSYRGRGRGRGQGGASAWCHICMSAGHDSVWCPKTKCNWCGAPGHQKPVCDTYKCYGCGKHGHISRNCPLVVTTGNSTARQPSRKGPSPSTLVGESQGPSPKEISESLEGSNPTTSEGSNPVSSPATASYSSALSNLNDISVPTARKRTVRPPISVENGAKKMLASVTQFTSMLSTEKLDFKMEELRSERDRIEAEYRDRVRKNEEAMRKLIEEKKLADLLKKHSEHMQLMAEGIKEALGMTNMEIEGEESVPANTEISQAPSATGSHVPSALAESSQAPSAQEIEKAPSASPKTLSALQSQIVSSSPNRAKEDLAPSARDNEEINVTPIINTAMDVDGDKDITPERVDRLLGLNKEDKASDEDGSPSSSANSAP